MKNESRKIKRTRKELGASLVEYGLLVALIAVVVIPSLQVLGSRIETRFADAATSMQGEVGISGCPLSDPDC